MLTIDQAKQIILHDLPMRSTKTVDLKSAIGYVLAEDVYSDSEMPPFNKAAMDGYAVIASDTHNTLAVIDEIPAGKLPAKAVKSGECSKIMTGAPIPQGADAVIMIEKTEKISANKIRLLEAVKPKQNVCLKGEDIKKGELMIRAGTLIRSQEIALLATCGKTQIKVYCKPSCCIIVTGNELVEPDKIPAGGKIRNSNGYSLAAQILQLGIPCDYMGIVSDSRDKIRQSIHNALSNHDVLIISGGVSVGEYDYVRDALCDDGVESILYQVAIKPGKPFYFGKKDNKRIFALPGNPVSSFVTFEVFMRPFLTLMSGCIKEDRIVKAILASSLKGSLDRVQYLPGILNYDGDNFMVEPIPYNGPADIPALSKANCFIILEAGASAQKGSCISVMQLE